MIYKKSVVLSAMDNSLKKAVLTLDGKASTVKGEVKLYNFVEEPMGVLTLGLLVDGKVHKAGLTRVGYMQYQFGSVLSSIPPACTCALIVSHKGESNPLLIGTIDTPKSFESMLLESLCVLKEKSAQKVEETLNSTLGQYEDEAEIQKVIDEEMEKTCPHDCSNCDYKHAFYEMAQQSNQIGIEPSLQEEIIKGKLRVPPVAEGSHFIDEIGEQINGLFDNFPREETLEAIIPNSKWVKIDFNKDNKFYVVGLIYENDAIKYVCYGVPAVWSATPPADFNEKAQWLPTSLDAPEGEGYWITYQDANDGELVAVNIE